MEKEQLLKRIMEPDKKGVKLRTRLQMGWLDSVKTALHERRVSVKQGRKTVRDRHRWRLVTNARIMTFTTFGGDSHVSGMTC